MGLDVPALSVKSLRHVLLTLLVSLRWYQTICADVVMVLAPRSRGEVSVRVLRGAL
jgi:hypothetical protein